MFAEVYATLSELLVGAAALLTICMVLWLRLETLNRRFIDYLRDNVERFIYGKKPTGSESGDDSGKGKSERGYEFLYALVVAMCLGMGLVVESAVDDAIDSNPVNFRLATRLVQFLVNSKEIYRFSAFFSVPRKESDGDWWKTPNHSCEATLKAGQHFELMPLGREVFLNHPALLGPVLSTFDTDTNNPEDEVALRKFMAAPARFLDSKTIFAPDVSWDGIQNEIHTRCKVATLVTRLIYYDGNNWALRNEPTASVLRRWSVQIDTVGSLSCLAQAIFLACLFYWAWRKRFRAPYREGEKLKSVKCWLWGGLIVTIVCAYAYVVGQKAYVGRAAGMYVSAFGRGEFKMPALECQKVLAYTNFIEVDSLPSANPEEQSKPLDASTPRQARAVRSIVEALKSDCEPGKSSK